MMVYIDSHTIYIISGGVVVAVLLLVLTAILIHRHRLKHRDAQQPPPESPVTRPTVIGGSSDADRVALIAYADRAGVQVITILHPKMV